LSRKALKKDYQSLYQKAFVRRNIKCPGAEATEARYSSRKQKNTVEIGDSSKLEHCGGGGAKLQKIEAGG